MRRRSDPDFELEPWAEVLVNYCYFGGRKPPMSVGTEPLEASRAYVPPKRQPKPRVRKAAPVPKPSSRQSAKAPRSSSPPWRRAQGGRRC